MAYKAKYDYLTDIEKLKGEIEEHKKKGSIFKNKEEDQPQVNLNFDRAENELKLAETMFKISERNELKEIVAEIADVAAAIPGSPPVINAPRAPPAATAQVATPTVLKPAGTPNPPKAQVIAPAVAVPAFIAALIATIMAKGKLPVGSVKIRGLFKQ